MIRFMIVTLNEDKRVIDVSWLESPRIIWAFFQTIFKIFCINVLKRSPFNFAELNYFSSSYGYSISPKACLEISKEDGKKIIYQSKSLRQMEGN